MKSIRRGGGLAPSRYSISGNRKPSRCVLNLVSPPVTWSRAGGVLVPAP